MGDEGGVMPTEMSARIRFLERYLIEGKTPAQIAASDATLGSVWSRIVGTAADGQYGRPFAFHQQAQTADWSAAWSRVRAPVLAMYGQYDWFESHDAASLIARIVNAKSPGRGTFVEMPGMNHHFEVYPSAQAAFREERGQVNPDPAVDVMLDWLRRVLADRVSGGEASG